ncbi:tetratricopeptide repeat protein, partial [Acinetobacter baumannii]
RADAYSNLAVVFQETDRHEKARRYCRIALALSPDYVEAFYHYGNSERELGFLPRAEQLYWRGLRISPQAADAANNLGFILLE